MARIKKKGYRNEVKVQRWLDMYFPGIVRTGNFSQRVPGAPDLERKGTTKMSPIRIVATVQDGCEPIISLRVGDLVRLHEFPQANQLARVYVQVKSRNSNMWIERLMRELEDATGGT